MRPPTAKFASNRLSKHTWRSLCNSGFFLILALRLVSGVVEAKCASGGVPSYNDIVAVMIDQNGCHSYVQDPNQSRAYVPVTTFDCSTYWALFWNLGGPGTFSTQYSQFNLKGETGTFHLSASLANAVAVLKKDKFFELSPEDHLPTETARSVLTVKRCAVVTKIRMYNSPIYGEPATLKVFEDLRSLIQNAQRTQVSPSPSEFGMTALFDL